MREERANETNGGTAGTRPSTAGNSGQPEGGTGGSTTGGSGGVAGTIGTAGSAPRGGQGGTAGASCADQRVPTTEFCPVRAFGCPMTLGAARHVDALCRLDSEFLRYTECDGHARIESTFGFGENSYDFVFSTATGDLVSGIADLYDGECLSIRTSAGTLPPLGGCASCNFFCGDIDNPTGAGGEGGGAGTDTQCAFTPDGRIMLP